MQAITVLKEKLHQEIEAGDARLLNMVHAMISEYNNYPEPDIPNADERLQLIREERIAYQKGKGKSHSWKEVKEMAVNKEKRSGI